MTSTASRLGRLFALPVIAYRRWIRPLRASGSATCRFEPSCSAYAVEALTVWGPFRGGWLAVRRLSRCHPWGGLGMDPVPLRGLGLSPAGPVDVAAAVSAPPIATVTGTSPIRRSSARASG